MVALRWRWMMVPTSTPGSVTAIASLIASSSRGRSELTTGVPNQVASSARPASVIA